MIPDKLIGFECYNNGQTMIGIADVTLPELAFMTESIKGAGIAGELETPVIGQFQALSTTINWRTLIRENIVLFAPKTYHFDYRGSIQIYNEDSGEFEPHSLKCVMRCLPKTGSLGNLDTSAGMGTSGEYEVIYMKLSLDETDLAEIDKLNYICIIEGVDYLAKVRKDIGKS